VADVTSRLRLIVDSSGLDRAGRRLRSSRRDARELRVEAQRLVAVFGSFASVLGGGLFGSAVLRETADFNKQIAAVGAVSGASQKQLEEFSMAARELGKTTAFSASQAAEGMQFLAMAGFSADEVLKTIGPSLQLAAAGALELGDAADIASNILTSFRFEASELTRVADVLAQAASSSNTSVEQLGQGFKFVGAVASNMSVSLEEVAAGMSVLSNAGLQAEMAGTGLRKVLTRLADPVDELRAKMGGLTVESDGLSAVIRNIAEEGLSVAEAIQIFGDRGGPAILNLVAGFEDLEKFTGENLEAIGRAADVAAGRLDNLAGDVRLLKSAYSEFLLSVGDDQTDAAARRFVQSLTSVINSEEFSVLSDTLSNGLTAAINLATSALMAVAPAIDEIARALEAATFAAGAFAATLAAAAAIRFAQSIATLVALERALGATNVAMALHSVLIKSAQRAWIGLTAVIAANPLGAIAVAISATVAAVVFFRDEIADLTFGVKDFGAVMQATFEVLAQDRDWETP